MCAKMSSVLHEVYGRVDHLLRLLCADDDDEPWRHDVRLADLPLGRIYPQRVPRPLRLLVAVDAAPVSAGFDGPQYVRSFAQPAVYARLADENALRWFECAICAHTKFVPAEQATQHCARHPPVCVPCLRRLLYCPFCRIWIGAASMRRLCLRVLRPSSPPLAPF